MQLPRSLLHEYMRISNCFCRYVNVVLARQEIQEQNELLGVLECWFSSSLSGPERYSRVVNRGAGQRASMS